MFSTKAKKKEKDKPKDVCQRLHAKKRAYQRYGLTLTTADLNRLSDQIVFKENCVLVQKQSNRVSIFDVIFMDMKVRVSYDFLRKQVITFLPIN